MKSRPLGAPEENPLRNTFKRRKRFKEYQEKKKSPHAPGVFISVIIQPLFSFQLEGDGTGEGGGGDVGEKLAAVSRMFYGEISRRLVSALQVLASIVQDYISHNSSHSHGLQREAERRRCCQWFMFYLFNRPLEVSDSTFLIKVTLNCELELERSHCLGSVFVCVVSKRILSACVCVAPR